MSLNIEIGTRLKFLREKIGKTQKDIAGVLGVTPAAYGKIEAGDRGLSSEYCIQLADYFGVTCDFLLRGISSENVDICTRTALDQTSVDALIEKEKHVRGVYNGMLKHKFEMEQLREKCITANLQPEAEKEIMEQMGQLERILGLENELLFRLRIQDAFINAMLSNATFLERMGDTGARAIKSTTELAAIKKYGHDKQMPADDVDEHVYRLEAAKYAAGNIFQQFFSEFCSADLVI